MYKTMIGLFMIGRMTGLFAGLHEIEHTLASLHGTQSIQLVYVNHDIDYRDTSIIIDETLFSISQKMALKRELQDEIVREKKEIYQKYNLNHITKEQLKREIIHLYSLCIRLFSLQEARELFQEIVIASQEGSFYFFTLNVEH